MIRRLQPWEISDIIPVAKAFYEQTKLGSPFDEHFFAENLHTLSAQGRLFVSAKVSNGAIVGSLVGMLVLNMMSGELMAQELFWYVMPEHRGGIDGIRMLADFEKWASEVCATQIIMANFHLEQTSDPVAALYEKRGFTSIETHHIKPIT